MGGAVDGDTRDQQRRGGRADGAEAAGGPDQHGEGQEGERLQRALDLEVGRPDQKAGQQGGDEHAGGFEDAELGPGPRRAGAGPGEDDRGDDQGAGGVAEPPVADEWAMAGPVGFAEEAEAGRAREGADQRRDEDRGGGEPEEVPRANKARVEAPGRTQEPGGDEGFDDVAGADRHRGAGRASCVEVHAERADEHARPQARAAQVQGGDGDAGRRPDQGHGVVIVCERQAGDAGQKVGGGYDGGEADSAPQRRRGLMHGGPGVDGGDTPPQRTRTPRDILAQGPGAPRRRRAAVNGSTLRIRCQAGGHNGGAGSASEDTRRHQASGAWRPAGATGRGRRPRRPSPRRRR